MHNKVTLSDVELAKKCSEWISKLCASGGQAWSLRVPVDFNNDPDVLFSEILKRFENKYDPFEPPPEGYDGYVVHGRHQGVFTVKEQALLHTKASTVRYKWNDGDWWLPVPKRGGRE